MKNGISYPFFERNKENAHLFNDDTMIIVQDVIKKNILYFLLLAVMSVSSSFTLFTKQVAYSEIKFNYEYDSLTKSI